MEYSWFYFLPFHYFKCIRPFPCRISVEKSADRLMGVQISSVQLFSHIRPFMTPWTAARQASLSITNSQSLPKLMSTESVMPSNHLILCRPFLLLPSIFPIIRVFSSESALHIRRPMSDGDKTEGSLKLDFKSEPQMRTVVAHNPRRATRELVDV